VLKESTGDDADGGVTLAEHIASNPIDSNLLGQAHPSVVDRVKATAPSAGGQKRKCPPPGLKRKQSKPPANQVMTQIELPPYHRHASQAVGAGTSARGAAQHVKKTRGPPLKSILASR
jgi:hypothetical protein